MSAADLIRCAGAYKWYPAKTSWHCRLADLIGCNAVLYIFREAVVMRDRDKDKPVGLWFATQALARQAKPYMDKVDIVFGRHMAISYAGAATFMPADADDHTLDVAPLMARPVPVVIPVNDCLRERAAIDSDTIKAAADRLRPASKVSKFLNNQNRDSRGG